MLEQLPKVDEKAARLACWTEKTSLMRLCNIAASSHLHTVVRTMVFRQVRNVALFNTFTDWAVCINRAYTVRY